MGAAGSRGPFAVWSRLALAAVGLYCAVAVWSLTASAGQVPVRSTQLHQPFVAMLAAAAVWAAVAAWSRFRLDRSSQNFLITVAFGALAVLYLPHALLSADGPDPTHLLFGPLSRLIFAALLAAAFVGGRVPGRLLTGPWPAAVGMLIVAVAVDVVLHSHAAALLLGARPAPVLRGIETAALIIQCGAAIVVVRRWRRDRAPFLLAVAGALAGLAVGSGLFLTTTPWLGRWWIAHLGLLVCALCLVLGIGGERARRGRFAAVAALDRLPLLAEHVVEATTDGVAVRDAAGRLVGWNPAAAALTGWSREEAEHRFHPKGDGLADLGQGRWVTIRQAQLRRYGDRYAVTMFSDARAEVQLRAARDELAGKEAYLTQILDVIDAVVFTCDTTGAVVHANQTARQLTPAFGAPITVDELLPAIAPRTLDGSPFEANDSVMRAALRGQAVDGVEVVLPLPDGARRMVMLHARPLHNSAGEIIGAVVAAYNITALREREADLQAFAAIAAHDLKSPLAVVAGYADLLHEDMDSGAPTAALDNHLRRIRTGVERMRRLIDDLLTYATARDAPLRPQPVDLHTLVTDVINDRTGHLRTTGSGDQPALFPDIYIGPLPTIHADPTMIRQLVDNLIGNALKYTLPGQPARIDISAHHRPDDGDWTRIDIADRGIGIPAHDQPHVFDTFHRAAEHRGTYTGTGLGLAICKRIVERHGGSIGVTDNPGGGTRIHFTLPTTDHLTTPTASTTEPPQTRTTTGTPTSGT